MYKKITLSLLSALCCLCVFAQTKEFEYTDSALLKVEEQKVFEQVEAPVEDEEYSDDAQPVDTTLTISPLVVSKDSLQNWKEQRRYAYMKNLDSLLRESQNDGYSVKRTNSGGDGVILGGIFSILQPLLWVLAILFVLFIFYRIFLAQGIFKRLPARSVADAQTEEEIILGQDYDKLIAQSISKADYRLATRYWFLKTLQRLSDRSFISFATDKTNSAYVREMPADKQQFFAQLVLNYEYVWYGHKEIDAGLYSRVEDKFTDFYKNI
ncbi:MAG: hypothetical protein WAT19_05005 [Ferruginibacter sp.]